MSPSSNQPSRPAITVRELIADSNLGLEMQIIAGEQGLDRQILHTRIQKSGLALAGHYHGIVPSRVQILGQTELSFLQRLSADGRIRSLRGFHGPPCSDPISPGLQGRIYPRHRPPSPLI